MLDQFRTVCGIWWYSFKNYFRGKRMTADFYFHVSFMQGSQTPLVQKG
jgi:hypothetical protein